MVAVQAFNTSGKWISVLVQLGLHTEQSCLKKKKKSLYMGSQCSPQVCILSPVFSFCQEVLFIEYTEEKKLDIFQRNIKLYSLEAWSYRSLS